MRASLFLLLTASLLYQTGCSRDKASPAPSATEEKAAPAGFQIQLTMDCPAYVPGSTTRLEEVEGGIAVLVTSERDHDVKDIQRYAAYVAEASQKADDPESALRFGGRTGDRTRNCPVILKDTRVTYEPQERGARLVVKSKQPGQVEALRRAAREKLEALQELQRALSR